MTHIIPKKSLNHADNSGESKMFPGDFLWWMETQISRVEKNSWWQPGCKSWKVRLKIFHWQPILI